jgi:hypothetical protein
MQLSFLPVAIPEAGLPRSFHGTEAVMPWDSRGHITGLARSPRGHSMGLILSCDGAISGVPSAHCAFVSVNLK